MPATIHNLINNASTTVSGSVGVDATSITVANTLLIEAPFKATFVDTGEIIEVGAISGTTWSSITRGAEGTVASSHATGTGLELRLTAGHLAERRPFNVFPSLSATMNTRNIRAAYESEGYLSFAPGAMIVARTGTEGQLFQITDATQVQGNKTTLLLASGTPNTVDMFHFYPSGKVYGAMISGLALRPETNGDGRHGVHFEGNSGGHLINSGMDLMMLGKDIWSASHGTFGGSAVKCTNSGDYMYRMHFMRSQLNGQFIVDSCGDSFLLETLHVQNNGQPGKTAIDVKSMVVGAGLLTIRDCNIIGGGGSIHVAMNGDASWNCVKIENVDSDYVTTSQAAEYGAACLIEGGTENTIRDSRFNCQGATGQNVHALRLRNCMNSSVYGNQLCKSGTAFDLRIDGDGDDPEIWGGNYVGSNRYHTGAVSNLDPAPRAAL